MAALLVATEVVPGALDSFDHRMVTGRSLREGMVLVDTDLGTPVYYLDHRMPRDPGRWFANKMFPAALAA